MSAAKDYEFYETVATEVAEQQAIQSYIGLTDLVFKHCVENFQGASLTAKEKKCIGTLSKKWLGATTRATQRFAELQHDFIAKQLIEPQK